MKPATLQRLRTFHRWAGIFFAPMILLFALTGLLQTLGAEDWTLPEWIMGPLEAAQDAHEKQHLRRGTAMQTLATATVVAMSLALILTTLVGVAMGFRMYPRKRRLMVVALIVGIVLPAAAMLI